MASCPHFLREVVGVKVPHEIYIHLSGIILIRGEDSTFYGLEDNLRRPFGVSFMLEKLQYGYFPIYIPKKM